jgi:hypothetical protein
VTGVMTLCPNGTYRAGWTLHTDAKAQDSTGGTTACTSCGAGILSEATDIDERDGGNDTTKLVAGSSFSCWIPAGWSMFASGVNEDLTLQYSARVCTNNTYGVANKTYGLQATPCKVSRGVIQQLRHAAGALAVHQAATVALAYPCCILLPVSSPACAITFLAVPVLPPRSWLTQCLLAACFFLAALPAQPDHPSGRFHQLHTVRQPRWLWLLSKRCHSVPPRLLCP